MFALVIGWSAVVANSNKLAALVGAVVIGAGAVAAVGLGLRA
jgi:hypothetical protein